MNKNMNRIGLTIVIGIFLIFYLVTTYLLDKRNISKVVPQKEEVVEDVSENYEAEKEIVSNIYNDIKILYDVINNKFVVNQDDTITIGDIIYKKITNFDDVMNSSFTQKGIEKYISDFNNYFAYTDEGYYLAGNLVSYQTYYFRGDDTNIYILDSSDSTIKGLIYEKWKTGNKNTLATIELVMVEGNWLVDDITILSAE